MAVIKLKRLFDNGNETIGILYYGDDFSYTLEDEHREKKLTGETRIPCGIYEIKFRKVLSPLTKKYRERYSFFKWHLELQKVPNFTHIYIHTGRLESHTDGCILVGHEQHKDVTTGKLSLKHTWSGFKHLYEYCEEKLQKGKLFIEIVDE
jgi:hypothetical protein